MTMHERFIIKKKEFIEFEKNFFNFVDVKKMKEGRMLTNLGLF